MLLVAFTNCNTAKQSDNKNESKSDKVIVAYVTSWSRIMPDPAYMTHINYAFGHVNDTFDGVRVDNEDRLKSIVALKSENPNLKVLLSIGGWGSGRFSEMAADEKNRLSFAKDCKRVVDEFKLDGIDIDWEYPTSSSAGISASENDTENYTLLMRDIRQAIGENALLTQATVASGKYVDHKAIDSYIDFTNIMSYDMGNAPKHHSALFRSENAGWITAEEAVKSHLEAGVSKEKLVMGLAFYGRGGDDFPNFMDFNKAEKTEGYTIQWDDTAKVPYFTNDEGKFVYGYENPQSLKIKCEYILEQDLHGAMYWSYDGDNEEGDLRKTVFNTIF